MFNQLKHPQNLIKSSHLLAIAAGNGKGVPPKTGAINCLQALLDLSTGPSPRVQYEDEDLKVALRETQKRGGRDAAQVWISTRDDLKL